MLRFPPSQKFVFLFVPVIDSSSIAAQNDIYAQALKLKGWFLHLSAESRRCSVKMWFLEADIQA